MDEEASYLDIYDRRFGGRGAYQDYLSIIKYWVKDRQSWMTALRSDDNILLASLIQHMRRDEIEVFSDSGLSSVPDIWRLKKIGVPMGTMLNAMYEKRSWKCLSILIKDEGFSFWAYTKVMVDHDEEVTSRLITIASHSPLILEEILLHVYMGHMGTEWRFLFIKDVMVTVDSEVGIDSLIDILLRNNIHIDDDALDSIMRDMDRDSAFLLVQYAQV